MGCRIRTRLSQLHQLQCQWYKMMIVDDLEPMIHELHSSVKNAVNYDGSIWFGDADVYLSVERVSDGVDLLTIKNVVSCFDRNNLAIFIDSDFGIVTMLALNSSESMTEYSKQYKFGDHRDWDCVSLDTLRVHEWKFGYGDARDKFHVYKKDPLGEISESAGEYDCGFRVENLEYALREISWAHIRVVGEKEFTIAS